MNWLLITFFVLPTVLIGFRFFLLLEGLSSDVFFDVLEGRREACFLGRQYCWHPVLPYPAPPPRSAPRPDLSTVCLGFGLGN